MGRRGTHDLGERFAVRTNFYSDGAGRYLAGQAPDLIVRADGSLSLIHSTGTVNGVEAVVRNTLLCAYSGGIYIGRDSAYDASGKTLIGYGHTGSPNSMNRVINDVTYGFNQTIWKNPRYGTFSLIGQYE